MLRKSKMNIKATLAALFRAPAFRQRSRYRVLVRSPVEFVIGAARAAGLKTIEPWMHGAVDGMGQILFRPPSVKGWTSGRGWLSSGAIVERLRAAERIAMRAEPKIADVIVEVAFQGDVPEAFRGALEKAEGEQRIALALGGPEFQLS